MKIIGDFQTSVHKALGEIDPNYEAYPGLVICGTHAPKDVDMQILELSFARELNVPVLGICWGMQVMAMEFARNTLKIEGATSEEIDPDSSVCVVVKMHNLVVGMKKVEGKEESHWHQYKVQDIGPFYEHFDIVKEGDVIEKMKMKDRKFYVGVQWHPEYQSSKESPHPLLVDFLRICSAE